ncbi:MJ1255/VC2487 family glycosyltransferase [Vibrio crassostreae]|uniref:MJ1255/VC2487 family glycosyltransferase n=2 Tax=Vibrio crassostreae TaxID=246167 RepID=UPI001B30DD52|nr:MJ1255/VC2487 family glycosyltransferase [Vibrio crassostreae]CAK2634102.1 putative Glycosyl transferase [Vibrio crassostreae]
MKILYGVQGTGNGHIARARAMAVAFRQQIIDVDFLFSGRDESKYFSMEAFGNYQTRSGLTFYSEQGQVKYGKTFVKNNIWRFLREINQIDLTPYDLVINDFEPVTAWAAKRQGVPCIGISHQNAFRYDVPKEGGNWIEHSVIQHFAPTAHSIGLHWYHFEQPILPPIVHTPIAPTLVGEQQTKTAQNFTLVYLPFEDLESISELLMKFISHNFVCYHPDVIEHSRFENIEFKPLSHAGFQFDLNQCSGVVANGGFELPSEALTLGKKLLLKPLEGQFEQQSNVATLEALGLAQTMTFLDAAILRAWLSEKQAEVVTYPDVASALVEWVLAGNWSNQDDLRKQLWDKVDFPSYASFT